MESQLQRPVHNLEQEDAQQNLGLHSGEGDQPGEKKSMLQKVKDKAKKLKGTVLKQGRGQGPEHENRYDENLEEDKDDAETANDREIHGAPVHDSNVNNTSLDKLADTRGDRIDPMLKGEAKARPDIPVQTGDEQEIQPENKHFPSPISVQSEEAKYEGPDVKLGPSMGLEEDPHSTKARPQETHVPPNYESKVPDPTGDGGKEAGVEPLIRGFDNLNVGDKSETKPDSEQQRTCTGSQDQFSPTQEDQQQQLNPESNPLNKLGGVESDPKSFDSNKTEGMPSGDSDTITGKVTSAITGSAISAKNTVASKLGYGGGSGQEGNNKTESQEEEGMMSPNKPESESAPGYTQKIAETVNPVYEKVAGAGNTVLSKFQGGSSGPEGVNSSDKPESGSSTPPGYTQKIAETLNPVYEKVAGAGTAVRSKFLGGGEAENQGEDLKELQTNP